MCSDQAQQGSQLNQQRHTDSETNHTSDAPLSNCSNGLSAALPNNCQVSHDDKTPTPMWPQARSSMGKFVPSVMRRRAQQSSNKCFDFAVQLFPDMTSLELVQKQNQQEDVPHFSGGTPPYHHNTTSVHDYIAHICPESAVAFGVDTWLDIYHVTLGSIVLSKDQILPLQNMMQATARALPPLTSLLYTTGELGVTEKPDRLNADVKWTLFYHIQFQLAASQQHILQKWMTALQVISRKIRAQFTPQPEGFKGHHITIRSHNPEPVQPAVLRAVAAAVLNNPMRMSMAGLRVQLAASQAERKVTPCQVGWGRPVMYAKPIYTSGDTASVLVEQQWSTRQAAQIVPEAISVAAHAGHAHTTMSSAAAVQLQLQSLSVTSN